MNRFFGLAFCLATWSCSHTPLPAAAVTKADLGEIRPMVKVAEMDDRFLIALENRCGIVADISTDPSARELFRLEDCSITKPRYDSPYSGDAGLSRCHVLVMHAGHTFVDPQRYSAQAILALAAPMKGRRACVVGSYEGLGQFYFYGFVPYERRYETWTWSR